MTMQSNSKNTVLIVDDNEMNRDLLARKLARLNHKSVSVSSGLEALDELSENTDIGAVLLDWMMPGMNGMEVLEKIRESKTMQKLPVIMVTARNESDDVVEALESGANDYVMKPIDFPVLKVRLNTAMSIKNLNDLKDEFMGIASHDLKNPLTTLMNGINLIELMKNKNNFEKLEKILPALKRSTKHMQSIIEDYIDLKAMDDGDLKIEKTESDLNGIVMDVVDQNYGYSHSKGVSLKLVLIDDVNMFPLDSMKIRQVVENLVGNAIKFSPKETIVTINVVEGADSIRFEVVDEGPGLTELDLINVFNKFSKLSNAPTGNEKSTGLGLSISKMIVEKHGGSIGVYNNESEIGVTFWFEIPKL